MFLFLFLLLTFRTFRCFVFWEEESLRVATRDLDFFLTAPCFFAGDFVFLLRKTDALLLVFLELAVASDWIFLHLHGGGFCRN